MAKLPRVIGELLLWDAALQSRYKQAGQKSVSSSRPSPSFEELFY